MSFRCLPILVALLALVGCHHFNAEAARRRFVDSGDRYFKQNKFREARILYRNAIKRDPKSGEAYFKLGETDLRRGDVRSAVGAYRRAVELLKDHEEAASKLADIYLAAYGVQPESQKPALLGEVESLAKAMFQRNPNSFHGTRLMAFLSSMRRDLPRSIELLKKADSIKPRQPSVRLPLISSLLVDNQFEEAEKLALASIEDMPNFTPAYDLLAAEYIRRGRLTDSEQILLQKVAKNPRIVEFRLQLARLYQTTQRKELSEMVVNEALALESKDPDVRLKVGDFLVKTQQFDRALLIFQDGASKDDAQQHAYQIRVAQVYAAENKLDAARKELETILKRDSKNFAALSMRAVIDLQVGGTDRRESAIRALQGLLSTSPNDVILHYNLGRAYQLNGDYNAAGVQFVEVVKRRPDFVFSQVALAQVSFEQRDYGRALTAASDALRYQPKNPAARVLKIRALVRTGKLRQARSDIEQYLKEAPGSSLLQFELSVIEMLEGFYQKAEGILLTLRARFPNDTRLVVQLSEVFYRSGRESGAFKMIEVEATKHPQDLSLQKVAAIWALKTGYIEFGERTFQMLLGTDPKNIQYMLYLAQAQRRNNKVPLAVATLQAARTLAPRQTVVALELAMALDVLGNPDQSLPLYREVLRSEPNNLVALNNTANNLAERGTDLDEALTLAQRAKQQAPSNDFVSDTMGLIYIKKNLPANAIAVFSDLVNRQPKNPSFHFHLGMAQLQNGKHSAARNSLQRALQLRPAKQDEARIRELLARCG